MEFSSKTTIKVLAVESRLKASHKEGRKETNLNAVKILSKNMKISFSDAMNMLAIPTEEQAEYLKLLES